MKFTKQQKTFLGIGALAVAALIIWQKTQSKKNNIIGFNKRRGNTLLLNPRFNQNEITEFLSAKNNKKNTSVQSPQLSAGCGGVLYTQGRRVSIYCDKIEDGNCVGDKYGCDRFNNRYSMSVLVENKCENGC